MKIWSRDSIADQGSQVESVPEIHKTQLRLVQLLGTISYEN